MKMNLSCSASVPSPTSDGDRVNHLVKTLKSTRKVLAALAVPLMVALPLATAQATIYLYQANLDGPSESPANSSPGTGYAQVNYDDFAHTLQVEVSFSGLLGTTTASHIHAATVNPFTGTAGVATTTPYFTGFPIGVTSGSYSNTLDLTSTTSYNSTFITASGGTTAGAETALIAAINAGKAYLNIHSTSFPGGEIRGFLVPVPEPSGVALLTLGGGALAWVSRRRRGL
jgi:hypothetical protein